jgi:hypothetical protein
MYGITLCVVTCSTHVVMPCELFTQPYGHGPPFHHLFTPFYGTLRN